MDSNVVVYAHDTAEPAKRERAIEVLADQREVLVVSPQVLVESFNALTRRLAKPKPLSEAREAIEALAELRVVPVDGPLAKRALSLSIDRQLSIWDAMIVEAARAGGCDRLLTEDLQDGAVFGEVTVEDPFVGLEPGPTKA